MLKDQPFVAEAHLQLVGVHVHIDHGNRHLHVQHADGIVPDRHALAATLLQRLGEQRAADGASIDDKGLPRAIGARLRADAHQSGDRYRPLRMNGQHAFCDLPAVQAEHRAAQIPAAGAGVNLLAVMNQAEGNIRVRQDHACDNLRHTAGLRHGLLEELEANRRVVKQLPRHNGRSLWAGRFRNAPDYAALVHRARAGGIAIVPRGEHQLAHCRDGRQRLAAETEGMQVEQIRGFADFAGRMALKGQAHIPAGDAPSVVRHAQIGDAAFANLHRHAGCASI